jgi:hypothetical protein
MSLVMSRAAKHITMLRFIIWLSLLARVCRADLEYVWPTYTCTTVTRMGQSVWCCDGRCPDGGDLDSGTGVCKNWLDPCFDPVNPPVCNGNQVYQFAGTANIDTGVACSSSRSCNWQNVQYSYQCCDCPKGYVSLLTNCLAEYKIPAPYSMCVGCNGLGESLNYDPVAGTYYCGVLSPTELCNALNGTR